MKSKLKKLYHILLGRTFTEGLLYKIFIYTVLSAVGYIFLFPIIFMLTNSLKDLDDLLNPTVIWLPTKVYFENYRLAFETLDYVNTFFSSMLVTLIPAIIQTTFASVVGYGFAKFRFPFKRTLLALLLISYIIPPQMTMIPKYVLFTKLGLTNSALSIIIPATFVQGLNSAIFVFIFYQFFRMLPKSLDEAALLDGANRYHIFVKIALPLSMPAYITALLFSFVWYFNETYIASIFLGNSVPTLQLYLVSFAESFESLASDNPGVFSLNEGIKNAGSILVIAPMLIMYFFLQKWFVQGIDKTGITGSD